MPNMIQKREKEVVERRKTSRHTFGIPTRIVVQDAATGAIVEEGHASIRDISSTGALISEIEVPSQNLPDKPFQIALIIEEGILKGVHMTCLVKRAFDGKGQPSCAMQIERISDKHRARIQSLCYKASLGSDGE